MTVLRSTVLREQSENTVLCEKSFLQGWWENSPKSATQFLIASLHNVGWRDWKSFSVFLKIPKTSLKFRPAGFVLGLASSLSVLCGFGIGPRAPLQAFRAVSFPLRGGRAAAGWLHLSCHAISLVTKSSQLPRIPAETGNVHLAGISLSKATSW